MICFISEVSLLYGVRSWETTSGDVNKYRDLTTILNSMSLSLFIVRVVLAPHFCPQM